MGVWEHVGITKAILIVHYSFAIHFTVRICLECSSWANKPFAKKKKRGPIFNNHYLSKKYDICIILYLVLTNNKKG